MNNLLAFDLFENVQSQSDIEKLTDIIISSFSSQAIKRIHKMIEYVGLKTYEFQTHDMGFVYIPELSIVGKGLSKQFRRFVKDVRLEVYIGTRSSAKGTYTSAYKEIVVNLERSEITEISEGVKRILGGVYSNDSMLFTLINTILNKHRDTLVHELQHAWDDYVSKGKFVDKGFNKPFDTETYLKFSHEINARYAQVVSTMQGRWLYRDSYGYKQKLDFNWKNYALCFKERFHGWKLLDKDQQNRLLSRLSQDYHKVANEEPVILGKKSIDIKDKVMQLEDELTLDGLDVMIHYTHDYNLITISTLKAESEEQEADAMKRLVKLADTYRKTIGITPYKGHTCIRLKVFVPLLKSLGFLSNSARFGSKRDYRFSEGMIRYSKR